MAKYRTYSNGIFGHKYKGYYIIRGEKKGQYAIWNEDKTVFKNNIFDYDECEWIIDKETADQSTLTTLKLLYKKEIHELVELYLELMDKNEKNGRLNPESKKLFEWTDKIRRRKSKNREF